jgi:YNFM family putative membrane transporter
MFAAGVATFGLLYCVQPLMPEFSRQFDVKAAESALSLSLTTAVLAVTMLFAGPMSDAWGRKAIMTLSLLSSTLIVLLSAAAPTWQAPAAGCFTPITAGTASPHSSPPCSVLDY